MSHWIFFSRNIAGYQQENEECVCALIGPSCPARFDLLTKMFPPPVSSRMNEQRFGSKGYYCERETKYRDTLNKRNEKRNKMLKKWNIMEEEILCRSN